MMEARIIEYPRGGLDYHHHNSPLIGEIPTTDYTHFHRSIDQLRSLNERGILNTNHFQNVLVPASTSPIIVQASGVYSEIKLTDDGGKMLNDYQSPIVSATSKVIRRSGDDELLDEDTDEYQQKKDNLKYSTTNSFRLLHSPQSISIPIAPQAQHIHYSITTAGSPIHQHQSALQHSQHTFTTTELTDQQQQQHHHQPPATTDGQIKAPKV